MPTLVLSTCGTSLLTNLAGESRSLVVKYANAVSREVVAEEDRGKLDAFLAEVGKQLHGANSERLGQLSAELNGLLRYYGGRLDQARDTHWLIATDTWLGNATAEAIGPVLEKAGHSVEIKRIKDLRTDSLDEFRAAMAELARLCAQDVKGFSQRGWKVVFNLTGGFKSVQGFMQALGMLYADESVYVFERTSELLRLPRLPLKLDADALLREHQQVFRRLAAGLPVSAEDARGVPDTLLMEVDGEVALSAWGEVVWAQGRQVLLEERLWPALDGKLRFGSRFERSVQGSSADELAHINQRLADLARHLNDNSYNPRRLDFKQLKTGKGESTHECDAWAKRGAKRLFGHFEGGVYVVDLLVEGLH